MRILKIYIKNINNLRGEHIIDFDKSPLAESGLFAIVGATGSGKSTLLDAITLALYNKVPRFGGISNSEIEKLGSIITHFMKEAMAEVTYMTEGMVYRSSWSIAKNRNDNLNPVKMELVVLDNEDKIITSKLSEVPQKNEEIIGLNYDQFIKSILLSQGEFAQFLKASPNDRSALLEKITGTNIYRKLGQASYQKVSAVENEGREMEIRLSQIQTFDKEEITTIKESIMANEQVLQSLRSELQTLNAQAEIQRNYLNLISKQKANEQVQSHWQVTFEAFEEERRKLLVHDSLSPFVKDITRYTQLSLDKKSTEKSLLESKNFIVGLTSEIKSLEKRLSEILQQDVNADNFRPIMQKFEAEFNALISKKKAIIEDGKVLREKLLRVLDNTDDSTLIKLKTQKDPHKCLQEIHEYRSSLVADGFEETNTQFIITQIQANNAKSIESQQKLNILNQQKEIKIKLELLSKEKEDLVARIDVMDQTLKGEVELLKTITASLVEWQQKLEEDAKIASLEKFAYLLELGAPCPLCGSVVHNLSVHKLADIGALAVKVSDKKNEQGRQSEIVKETEKRLFGLSAQLEANRKSVDGISENAEWNKSLEELDLLVNQLVIELASFDSDNKSLQRKAEVIKVLEVIKQAEELLTELNEKTNEFKKYDNNLKALLIGIDNQEENAVLQITNSIQDKLGENTTKLKQLLGESAVYEKELQRITRELLALENGLMVSLQDLGFESIQSAEGSILDSESYKNLSERKSQIDEEKVKLESMLATIRKDILTMKEAGLPKEDLELLIEIKDFKEKQHGVIGQNLGASKQALVENTKREDDKKAIQIKFDSYQLQVKKWRLLKEVIGDSTGNKFASFAQHLTLEHLVKLANRRLNDLTDRYLIAEPKVDGEIEMIDLYQANTIRSAKTLSGGETFLISLSFALALSDLASREYKLESLFIDEGFGTLDSDTLETALNTLERLQSESNKTIGIISHVESLKERINTQIRLVKDAGGYSSIEVITVQ